jgi:hypothetical protein
LNPEQQIRLLELETKIATGLSTFLEVGAALLEIREQRLYRATYKDFESYCRGRWNFSAHHGARIIRSLVVAQRLLEGPAHPENGDCPLPGDVSETLLRPLTSFEPGLQQSIWRLASTISDGKPTPRVLKNLVTVVQHAIDRGRGGNGAGQSSRGVPKARTKLFWERLHQLCTCSIPPGFLLQGVGEARAKEYLASCELVIGVCHELVGELRSRFPRL